MERPSLLTKILFKKSQTRGDFSSEIYKKCLLIKKNEPNESDFNNYNFGMKDVDQTNKDLERLMMERDQQVPGIL